MSIHGIPRIRMRKGLSSGGAGALSRRVRDWWNALPEKQLTRRGLMELPADDLLELGFVRERDVAARRRLALFRYRRF